MFCLFTCPLPQLGRFLVLELMIVMFVMMVMVVGSTVVLQIRMVLSLVVVTMVFEWHVGPVGMLGGMPLLHVILVNIGVINMQRLSNDERWHSQTGL